MRHRWLLIMVIVLLAFLAWGTGVGHAANPLPPNSAGAGTPFTTYTGGVVMYVLLTTFLVLTLLGGAFVVINVGMMSKREEDRTGGRTPSDVGILKHNVWPEAPYERHHLPAEEDLEDIPPGKRTAA